MPTGERGETCTYNITEILLQFTFKFTGISNNCFQRSYQPRLSEGRVPTEGKGHVTQNSGGDNPGFTQG